MSTKVAVMALATAASALASAAAILAEELSGDTATQESPTAAGSTEAPAKRRGRPPGSGAAAPPTEEEEKPKTGKTYEELKELIAPAVEAGMGAKVTALIKKYAESLKDLADNKPESHLAFEQALAPLLY